MPHFCSLNPLHSLLGMLSLYFWMFSLMVHVHTCQLTCFNKKEAAFLACFKQLMFFISRISSYGTSHYSIFYNCKHAIVLDRPQKATGYINIWCIKLTSLQTRDIGRKWFCNRVYKFKNLTWSAQIESRSPEFRLIKKPNQILCAKWHFCCLFILFQFTNYTAVRTKTNTLNMQNKVSRCVCEYDVFFCELCWFPFFLVFAVVYSIIIVTQQCNCTEYERIEDGINHTYRANIPTTALTKRLPCIHNFCVAYYY